MNDNYITLTIGKKKNIALIAHDNKKADLIEWCEQNKDILTQHFLCGTGTTARMITDKTGLPVKGYNSGPFLVETSRLVQRSWKEELILWYSSLIH